MRLVTEIVPTQTPVLVTRLKFSLFVLLGLVFIPWLLYLIQTAALFGSVKCGLSSVTSGKFSKAAFCVRFAKKVTLALRLQKKAQQKPLFPLPLLHPASNPISLLG